MNENCTPFIPEVVPRREINALLVYPRSVVQAEYDLRNQLMEQLSKHLIFFADQPDHREQYPSLALLTVAALLPAHWNLRFVDENLHGKKETERQLESGDVDLVFLSLMNSQAERGQEIAFLAQQQGVTSVCGGYYPSTCPEKLQSTFDCVIIGEAEDTIPRFLLDYSQSQLKPIYVSQGNNPPTSFPVPRMDLLEKPEFYHFMPVQATRGCRYHCTFCTIPELFGRKFRKKSITQIVAEITTLKAVSPRIRIAFVDENLFLDKQWARKLAEALIPLRINWECYSDIGVGADKELLQLLYKSGCRQMQIGLESLSPVVLDNVSSYKASMRPYYEEYIQNIQAAGIQAIGMFIIGFDQDEFSLFAELDKFLETTSMFNYIVEWLTPVPGTKIFEELAAVGRIRDGLWEKEESISFVPLNISEAEMEYGTIWLSWQFAKPSRRQKRHKYFKQVMKNILRGTSKNSIPHKIT